MQTKMESLKEDFLHKRNTVQHTSMPNVLSLFLYINSHSQKNCKKEKSMKSSKRILDKLF